MNMGLFMQAALLTFLVHALAHRPQNPNLTPSMLRDMNA